MTGCSRHYRADPILFYNGAPPNSDGTTHPGTLPWMHKTANPFDEHQYVLNPYTYAPAGGCPLYELARKGNTAEARYARNELQEAIVRLSDEAVGIHLGGVRATDTATNVLLGAAGIGLTGAASVAAGDSARALSAAATGTQGSRELFSEQVYRNTMSDTVIQLIHKDREVTLQQMRLRHVESTHDYSVEEAITDANQYHAKGSFLNGLTLARSAADDRVRELNRLLSPDKSDRYKTLTANIRTFQAKIDGLQLKLDFAKAAVRAGDQSRAADVTELTNEIADLTEKVRLAELERNALEADRLEKKLAELRGN
jgi:hypothetical protein